MELDKNCNNLNNVESLESNLSTAQTLDSDLNSFISVERRYAGIDSDNIEVSVDQSAKTISATLKQNKFATMADFPAVGSDRQIYVDLSNKSLWIYDTETAEYVKVGGIIDDKPTFETIQALVTHLNGATIEEINQGESLYVLTTNVPDFWVYKVVETSVPYTYTTDSDLISQIKENGFVQIGHYQISLLETEKITVDSELSETSTNPVQNKVISNLLNHIGIAFNQISEDVENIKTNKQDKLIAGENITIDENNVISATGGGGLTIADLPKFINKIYINTGLNASSKNITLPCVSNSDFVVIFPDGTIKEYGKDTTSISHTSSDRQVGWMYIYGDWRGIKFDSTTNGNKKSIVHVEYDNNIDQIYDYAFYGCGELISFKFPEREISIGQSAFSNTTYYKDVIFPKSLDRIYKNAFSNKTFDKIELPANLTSVAENCFTGSIKVLEINQYSGSLRLSNLSFSKVNDVYFRGDFSTKPSITTTSFGTGEFPHNIFIKGTYLRDFKTATNWTAYADKIYPIGGNYSETITIPSTAWDSTTNSATVEVVGSTTEARNVIEFVLLDADGKQAEDTYGLKGTQGTMQMTFTCEEIPTEDIKLYIISTLTNY